ncbi:MAG: DUF5989 family protein [Candidatus Omnitrophota bacterium]
MPESKKIWEILKTRKKLWVLPLIIVLAVVGVLIFLCSGNSSGPLVYPVFNFLCF